MGDDRFAHDFGKQFVEAHAPAAPRRDNDGA
jgi:hypothetical protein